MNSPSSSDTMFHPMRMWRLSDSDLYCVAMKMRRRPEFTELREHEVDDPVGAAEVDRRLGALAGQGRQAFAGAACEHDHERVVPNHGGLPGRSCPRPRLQSTTAPGRLRRPQVCYKEAS